MHQGNWTCSTCGGSITELPFEPKSAAGLTCRTCYMKKKDGNSSSPQPEPDMSTASEPPDDIPFDAEPAGEPAPPVDFEGATPSTGEKPKFTGNWTCAECGGSITSLPFEPRNTSNLKCIDCFKKSKG